MAEEQSQAVEGMISQSSVEEKDSVVGVPVEISSEVILFSAISILGIIVVSILGSSIYIARQKPKDILIVSNESVIQVGELIIDSLQHTIYKGKQEVSVINIEFQTLYFLALHKGMTMSKEQIYEYVWNGEYVFDDSNITSHIRRLRVKIEDDLAKPKYIQTV